MRNKKNTLLAFILSLMTVFTAAFTSLAGIPAVAAASVKVVEINSDQVALSEDQASIITEASDSIALRDAEEVSALEVEEVVEGGSSVKETAPAGETGKKLLGAGAGETINWWITENEESSGTYTLHISTAEAPEEIDADDKGTYDQTPEYEVVATKSVATKNPNALQGISRYIKSDEAEDPGELDPDIVTAVIIDSPIAPTVVSSMFYSFQSLETVKGIKNLDTSNAADMSEMFYFCSQLESLDLSGLNTSNVENMSSMFWECQELKEVNLGGFDTSKVTSMSDLFFDCWALRELDLSGFDTSNVEDMSRMFYHCMALTELDLSSFDTSKVKNVPNMFLDCGDLTTIYVSEAFDLSGVIETESEPVSDSIDEALKDKGSKNMFSQCSALIGGAGTKWANTNPTDKTYACIDDPENGDPGYFTGLKEISVPAGLPGVTYIVKDETDSLTPVTLNPKSTREGLSAYIVKYGSKITITAVPAEGYKVTGTNPYVIGKVEKDTAVNRKDLPAVEKIPQVTYTVTFDTDGGSAIAPQQVEEGATATEPAAPVKANCRFEGWFDEKDQEWDFANHKITADVTIYAHWERKSDPKPTPVHNDTKSEHTALFTGTWNSPVKNGTWTQDKNGVWHYTSSETFRNTWGYIVNPYAREGQNIADWFWFDQKGNMLTGWQFINGKWYYLNPIKDGTLGACQLGGITPDGWTVDASGAWVERIPKK